jgi:Rod binding domain-containing protein
MDISSTPYLNSYVNAAQSSNSKNSADSISDKAKNLSSASSKEDLKEAVKSFEGYFLEQILKKEKENIDLINGDDGDLTTNQLEDFYMDQTISKVSSEMVDKNFGSLTDEFTDSLARTYHISDSKDSSK